MSREIKFRAWDEELCTIEIDETDCSGNCDVIGQWKKACDDRDSYIKELLNINLEREKIYMEVLEVKGEEKQIMKLFEEFAELQKEICKYTEDGNLNNHHIEIAEEIADVEIMLEQMKLLFELDEAVAKHKEYKINRLAKRLKMEDIE